MTHEVTKTLEERKVEFLIELTRLTRETGIIVWGCGCCDSPDLIELEPVALDERAGYAYGNNRQIRWTAPGDLLWDDDAGSIVRPARGEA